MQMCGDCGRMYDESEYSKCPYCHNDDDRETGYIVYDKELGKALTLYGDDYEEFKKTHPEYN